MDSRFITKEELDILKKYYYNPENEIDNKPTEQGFIDWYEDLTWERIDEITTINVPWADTKEEYYGDR